MIPKSIKCSVKCIDIIPIVFKLYPTIFIPYKSKGINGFRPIDEEIDTMKVRKVAIKPKTPVYDSLKISYIKKMVEESIDTKIVFVVSPWWNGADTIPYQPIRDICREKNILS